MNKHLTTRELEVLQLAAQGCSRSETAGMLGITEATVRTHRQNILRALEVHTMVRAVVIGLRTGLIE